MVEAMNPTTSIKLKVVNGLDKNGSTVYASKTISGISTTLADADIMELAQGIESLMAKAVEDVYRINTSTLVTE